MAYPYEAKTNKSTQLIVLGGNNIKVPKGKKIVVHAEDGAFGTVSIQVQGRKQFGSMLVSDYSRVG